MPAVALPWTEGAIAGAIARQTLASKCVVIVPNCNWTGHECDVLGVTTDLRVIDVEVKISRADLKADAKKDKWWHHLTWGERETGVERQRREWPPKVWKHYYAMPEELWQDALFEALPSERSGVLLMSRRHAGFGQPITASCLRRATPNKDAARLSPESAIDVARLANLRMWDAFRASEDARLLLAARETVEA